MNNLSNDPRTTFRKPKSWVIAGISLALPFFLLFLWFSFVGEREIGSELKQGIRESYQEKYGDSNYNAYPTDEGLETKIPTIKTCSASFDRISNPIRAAYPPMRSDIEFLFAEADPYLTAWYEASEGGMPWRTNYYGSGNIDFLMTQTTSKLYAASAINYAASNEWELAFAELEQGRKYILPLRAGNVLDNLVYMSALAVQVGVLEEMIRWNPSDEILLQIDDQLNKIIMANQPIPVEVYLSSATAIYASEDNPNKSILDHWASKYSLMNYQSMMQTRYLKGIPLRDNDQRSNSISLLAIPASVAQSTSFVDENYSAEIDQVKLPDSVIQHVPASEHHRLKREVFIQEDVGNHGNQRKFNQTNFVLQKMRIGAVLYFRENGEWPTEFAQLPGSVFPHDDYENKSGIFSDNEVFGPFYMKDVQFSEHDYSQPSRTLQNKIIRAPDNLMLGEFMRFLTRDYQVNMTTSEGYINITNKLDHSGRIVNADPIKFLSVAHLLKEHRQEYISNMEIERVNFTDEMEIFDTLESDTMYYSPWRNVIIKTPLSTEQAAIDATTYEQYKASTCDLDIKNDISQDRLNENHYSFTADLSIPLQAFAIYSAGPDGQDNGGTRSYVYFTKKDSELSNQADMVTYLAEPKTGTE